MNKLWASFFGIFFLYSCHSSSTWMDDHIDRGTKSEIDKLNAQIVESLSAGDYGKSVGVFSDKLKETDKGGHFDSLFAQAKDRVLLSGFRIRNQFYVKSPGKTKEISLMSGGKGDHDYTLNFTPVNDETFVTVGYFEDSLQTLSLVTVYGKYGDTWKLNMFHMGIVKLMNRDAFDWYQRAADHFKSGSLVDASNDLNLCQQVLYPGNRIWHYQQEKKIFGLNQDVSVAIRRTYTFPLTVDRLLSKPRIFQEFPQVTKQGYFPMILYISDIKISDTAALRQECDSLHQVIGHVFNGLDRNNEYIIYRVFEKMPSDTALGTNYEFVRKTR
ncbi:MAG: hypothetical protein P4L51_18775 [Puia sp.]|nr:hypothetical protein [Puia sp.]